VGNEVRVCVCVCVCVSEIEREKNSKERVAQSYIPSPSESGKNMAATTI